MQKLLIEPVQAENPVGARSSPVRSNLIGRAAILVIITLATHGLALFDGKVLDDYAHQKGLREHGWSFGELMYTLRIEPATFLHTWWQTKPVVWHYFRPFFILCMKFVFIVLGRGDPVSLHAFSLVLHVVSVLLVWQLCRLLTSNETWSLVGGLLFAIYPHSVITVAWPSSQNVVIQTTLLLAMMLTYLRASRLLPGIKGAMRGGSIPPLSGSSTAWTLIFWLLAIFTRENAILFPAILASMDLAFGGWRHLWVRRWLYVFFGVVAIGLVMCREWMQVPPLPDVYAHRPDGDWSEYLPWLAAKFLHYLCASIWISPMSVGPTGRYAPWSEATRDCLLMIAIVVGLGLIYWRAARLAPGWWIWPFWIVLSILPVTAVVATPHSGYMSGVGWAIAAALAPATVARVGSRMMYRITAGTVMGLAIGAAFMAPVNRLQWSGIASAERLLPAWVKVSPPSDQVRHVFLINMPFVNIYAKLNLVDNLGSSMAEREVYVLTYAPRVMGMDRPSVLEQVDSHSFTLTSVGLKYFSGLVGRFALEAFRGKELWHVGDRVDSGEVITEILEADEHGVGKLKFTFKQMLTDPSYCFYLATPECAAARTRFNAPIKPDLPAIPQLCDAVAVEGAIRKLEAGYWLSAIPLFATAADRSCPGSERSAAALHEVVGYMTRALGAPVQTLFDRHELSPDEWKIARDWWLSSVDRQALSEIWAHRHDFDDLVYLRYEIDWDRFVAGQFIHTDLYLSGPPWDDMRPLRPSQL